MEHFLDTSLATDAMDLYGPMVVADFGAGAGFFTIPAAQKISREGTVYALDIQEPPLEVLRRRARDLHLYNVETMRADLERPHGSNLRDFFVDRVIIANILFQAPDKQAILKEAFRILKKNGKIIIVEWKGNAPGSLGPRGNDRINKETLRDWLVAYHASYEKEFAIGDHHYGIVCKNGS